MISVQSVERRRPRKSLEEAKLYDFTYKYKVRVPREGKVEELQVCYKAFISFFGLTNRRVQTIKQSLALTGKPPTDKRGMHKNRPRKTSDETEKALMDFFGSLKGRKAHYCLHDSKRVYLSENLNVKKLLALFLEKNPQVEISYEKFRQTFVEKFNIAFGYPRMDTCATCDEQKAKETMLQKSLGNSSGDSRIQLEKDLSDLQNQMKLHKLKAEWFYRRKRDAKNESRKSVKTEAIAVDFGRNISLPDISTSEVYFRRQLSFYLFNVHVLASGESIFFHTIKLWGKRERTMLSP